MEKTVLIAIGNSLRGDDGAAHRVLELLGPLPGVSTHALMQLTPELALEIAAAETVFFLDADVRPGEVGLEAVEDEAADPSPITHSMSPATVARMSRLLYGFSGKAMLCRIPGIDFSEREGLSAVAEGNARRAAALLAEALVSTGG